MNLKTSLLLTALVIVAAAGTLWLYPPGIFGEIRAIRLKEAELSSSAVAPLVAKELAILCETSRIHPDWFVDEPPLAPAWTPQIVLKYQPTWVEVSPDGARVEFGGGFYHFGYSLEPAPQDDPTAGAVWILSLYREESPSQEIARVTILPTDVLTRAEFIQRTFTEFERRIGVRAGTGIANDGENSPSVQRVRFALKHAQIDEVRAAIRETANSNPAAWHEVLLTFLLDRRVDPENADRRLQQWASTRGGFSAWLLAAYAYDKAGDLDAAVRAVERACETPADDPEWLAYHARARGHPMCRRLYILGRFSIAEKLCDHLLRYKASGDHMADSLTAIRDACRAAAASSSPARIESFETGDSLVDPFTGIDVNALLNTPVE